MIDDEYDEAKSIEGATLEEPPPPEPEVHCACCGKLLPPTLLCDKDKEREQA